MAEDIKGGVASSDEELVAGFSGPAVMANKVLLTVGGPNARLSFLEVRKVGDEEVSHYRAAVSVEIEVLLKLGDMIDGLREKVVRIAPPESSDG